MKGLEIAVGIIYGFSITVLIFALCYWVRETYNNLKR